jgi:site-specific recombinase XerD
MKNTETQERQTKVTVVLDKRSKKKDGTFPVKVRVWDGHTQKAKRYGTKMSLAEREFQSAWETVKPRREFQPLRNKLQDIVSDAQKAVDQLEHFTFEAFERKAGTPKGEAVNVFHHYGKRIDELKAAKQVGTAMIYGLAVKSLRKYAGKDRLTFAEVTPKFLQGYEDSAVQGGMSATTVGIYARTLRTIFNDAIAAKDAHPDQYPFGRKKYVVPASSNPKKALTPQQLKALRDAPAATPEQERARAFFFFSYASNGMNVKDIALLRWEQFEADRFTFTRAKTKRTKKDRQTAITVFLTDFHRDIISQYGSDPKRSGYVFSIVSADMDAERQQRTIKAFTRYMNQHLAKLCEANDLPTVSTYWARHSFATVAVRKGASMEFMRESLGHSDMKTTLNYFAGFDDEAKKELAVSIMDF